MNELTESSRAVRLFVVYDPAIGKKSQCTRLKNREKQSERTTLMRLRDGKEKSWGGFKKETWIALKDLRHG